jgi:hypothetical protein
MPESLQERIVRAILADLLDRKGFDWIWDSLDRGIKHEVISTWIKLVRQELEPADVKPRVFIYDWKENVNEVIEDVVDVLEEMRPAYAYEHQTGSDDYCLVLSATPMTPEEVERAYNEPEEDEEE